MTGEDAHLEAQYEDQQAPDVEDLDQDEPCEFCGPECTCDEQVDAHRDKRWD